MSNVWKALVDTLAVALNMRHFEYTLAVIKHAVMPNVNFAFNWFRFGGQSAINMTYLSAFFLLYKTKVDTPFLRKVSCHNVN